MRPEGNETLSRPAEFEFMSLGEWHSFNRHVLDALDRSCLDVADLEPGALIFADGRHLGLLNLAQLCHLGGPDTWDELIDKQLDTLFAHIAFDPEPFARSDLRIRLVPDDHADRDTHALLGARPFAEGVIQTLAVRLSDSVRPVPTSEIEELGWDVDEAWATAWGYTRTLERPEEINFVDVGGAEVVHLFSEHFFGASFVPFLGDIVDDIGEHGALVSIPVRHSVLVHPIHDESMMQAVQAMIPITRQVNRNGPGSVSAHLYWWRHGTLTWIPTYFAPDGIEFYPPEELVDVIHLISDFG